MHVAFPLPQGDCVLERVTYVELDLLLRDGARLQRVVRWRRDVPALRSVRTAIAGMDRACEPGPRAYARQRRVSGRLKARAAS